MAAEPAPNLFPPIITDEVPTVAGRRTGGGRQRTPLPRRGAETPTVPAAPPPPGKSQPPGQQPAGRQPPPLRGRRGVPIITATPEEGEPLPWKERVKQWLWGFGGEAMGVSLALHGVLLLILALMVYAQPREETVITTVYNDTGEVVEFEPLDMDFDMLPEEELQTKNPLLEPAPAAPSDILADTTIDKILGSGEGLLGKQGGAEAFNLPKKFFSKGSFTVWTEPQDPAVGEDYDIVIQVDVSDAQLKGTKYPKQDISGSVKGTDNYYQEFGGRRVSGYLPVVKHRVQFRILVPGAMMRLVRDTINVRSEMLREEQTIEIVF